MPALAIRKSAYDALSVRDKTILRLAKRALSLGEPALYKTAANVQWYIFDDGRFTLEQLAYLGTIIVGIATNVTYQIPTLEDGSVDREQLESDVLQWAASRVVLPNQIAYTEGNVWQQTLNAQGTPAAVQAADSVPPTLTPVD